MPIHLNLPLLRDYARTFPERVGETLLHFGDSRKAWDLVVYEQRTRRIVEALARRQRRCHVGKRSGHTGLVELVRVVEQTGLSKADLRPVPPDQLIQVLREITPYPVTRHTIKVLGRDQLLIGVDILAIDPILRATMRAVMRQMMDQGKEEDEITDFMLFTFRDQAASEALEEVIASLRYELAPETYDEQGQRREP
jgi:hypothetical protein